MLGSEAKEEDEPRTRKMSRYQVDKLLRDLRREPELAARFRNDVEAVLDQYQIDAVERDLLKRWEVRELYDRGVNPLLLLLAHGPAAGKSMQEYAAAMNPGKTSK
jgi:aromatic-ring opening dioxygenase LigAB LigA subunit